MATAVHGGRGVTTDLRNAVPTLALCCAAGLALLCMHGCDGQRITGPLCAAWWPDECVGEGAVSAGILPDARRVP